MATEAELHTASSTPLRSGVAARDRAPAVREAFGVAWLPWLVARVITLAALALERYEVHKFHLKVAPTVGPGRSGLLGWDAWWYFSIASKGYHGTARAGLRFFPLYPVLGRVVHDVTLIPTRDTLVILANLFGLIATMLVAHVATSELASHDVGRRAAWLFSLAPPAFAYVMGYAETMALVLALATFVCLRRERWWYAAAFGLLAGLSRPLGFLLVVPAVIEVAQHWRAAPPRSRAAQGAAVVAPFAGLVAYLGWVGIVFGSMLEPIRQQRAGVPKSISADPLVNAYRDASRMFHGANIGSGLHLPWVLVALALCIAAVRKLPLPYSAYGVCVVVAALAGSNFESFERYALSAFPLTIAAATMTESRRVETTALILSAVAMFAYAFLAFQGTYVP